MDECVKLMKEFYKKRNLSNKFPKHQTTTLISICCYFPSTPNSQITLVRLGYTGSICLQSRFPSLMNDFDSLDLLGNSLTDPQLGRLGKKRGVALINAVGKGKRSH